jgi:uncharacterized protein (DUF4415 family)
MTEAPARKRGRPSLGAERKEVTSLRLPADVLAYFAQFDNKSAAIEAVLAAHVKRAIKKAAKQ